MIFINDIMIYNSFLKVITENIIEIVIIIIRNNNNISKYEKGKTATLNSTWEITILRQTATGMREKINQIFLILDERGPDRRTSITVKRAT